MRLLILAVGHARGTSEAALAEDFIGRAKAMGKRLGFSQVAVEEIPGQHIVHFQRRGQRFDFISRQHTHIRSK